MKKIVSLRCDALALVSTGLALIFVLITQTPGRAAAKCKVCHNTKNPNTVEMSCDQVNKYLANHPGDYAGPCQNTTAEQP